MASNNLQQQKIRAKKMAKRLKKLFPRKEGTALRADNPWELLVAVILSAQCTDKRVNKVTKDLFLKYQTLDDYVNADQTEFEKDIHSTGFYRNKTKHILGAARMVQDKHGGEVPHTMEELTTLPGVARKTANVVLGNAFGIYEGIAVDTHVRRFARKFDLTESKNPTVIERDLMELLPQEEWFDFGNNLIYYGREICSARPHECAEHPLSILYPPAAENWPRST